MTHSFNNLWRWQTRSKAVAEEGRDAKIMSDAAMASQTGESIKEIGGKELSDLVHRIA